MSIRVEFPLNLVSLDNARWHWAKKAKYVKDCRFVARAQVRAAIRYAVRLPLIVTLTRYGWNEMDDDNLRGAFKPLRDGVADGLNLPNDRDGVTWRYAQVVDRKHTPRIVVEIASA